MTSREQEVYVAHNWYNSTKLFERHRMLMSAVRSSAKIRTLRRAWRRVLRSVLPELFPGNGGPTLYGFSWGSTIPTSVYQYRITVTSHDGQHKASFFGTPYQLSKQVNHFLATGLNGISLPEKSLTDYPQKASSSSSSATSLPGILPELIIKRVRLLRRRTHLQGELEQVERRLQAVEYSLKQTGALSNLGKTR